MLIVNNVSVSDITVQGITITAGNSYTVPTYLQIVWASDASLIAYVTSGASTVSDGTNTYAGITGTQYLSSLISLQSVIGNTIQGTLSLNGDSVNIGTEGLSTVLVHVTGSWTGNSIYFESTVNGTDWIANFGTDVTVLDGNITNQISTAPAILTFNVSGFKFFRAVLNTGDLDSPATVRIGSSIGSSALMSILGFVFTKSYMRDGNGGVLTSTTVGSKQALDINIASTAFQTRSDTFTTTGNGTTVDVSSNPCSSFTISVKQTGTVTSWTVVLEGSVDGSNFTTILSHTKSGTGDGIALFSGSSMSPCLYFRSRCSAVVLGGGTNVVSTILGVS